MSAKDDDVWVKFNKQHSEGMKGALLSTQGRYVSIEESSSYVVCGMWYVVLMLMFQRNTTTLPRACHSSTVTYLVGSKLEQGGE